MAILAPLFDLSWLESHMTDRANTLVLAANRRLAAKIQQAYQQHAHDVSSTLALPNVVAISDYLLEQYQRGVLKGQLAPRQMMSSSLHKTLWKEAIEENTTAETALLKPDSAAETAMSAYQLALQYRLCDTDLNSHLCQWRDSYIARCEQLGLIDTPSAESLTVELLGQQSFDQPCLFIGFEALPPLYQQLFNHFNAKSVNFEGSSAYQALFSFNDAEAELTAAIDYGLKFTHEHPGKRFGIVDAALSQRRDIVERLVQERLYPESNDVSTPRRVCEVNISAAQRAGQLPLLAVVPELLHLWLDNLSMETLYGICHCPFLAGSDSEGFARSRFYLEIYQRGRPDNAQAYLREIAQTICPDMAERWQTVAELGRRQGLSRHSFNLKQWLALTQQTLTLLGWPGQRETDSAEFQQLTLWQDILLDLSTYPDDFTLSAQAYIGLLREQLANTPFQAKVEDSALQILGSLEAANLSFAGLWVLSMTDNHFPAKANPNPLISLDTQRTLQMPHCDARRELHFAQGLLASFKASTPHIIFSYARFDGDIEVRPSPLLQGLNAIAVEPATPVVTAVELELFTDEQAPAVVDPGLVSGGASLLADQSSCPFKAFAIHRLGIKRIDPVTTAMPAHVRGTAVHDALEILLPKGLLQGNIDEHVATALKPAIDAALNGMARQRPDIMHARYRDMEAKRLEALLVAWLTIEKQRPPFTIFASEQPCHAKFAGLTLKLRVDRIDQLSANRLMVIDYKTGAASIGSWLDERPDDPQLLLYALLLDDGRVEALAKASLKRDEMGFKGLCGHDVEIEGIKPLQGEEGTDAEQLWQRQKIRWHDRLEQLAAEFMQGDAQVLPVNNGACQFCHLQDVCRIGERR